MKNDKKQKLMGAALFMFYGLLAAYTFVHALTESPEWDAKCAAGAVSAEYCPPESEQ